MYRFHHVVEGGTPARPSPCVGPVELHDRVNVWLRVVQDLAHHKHSLFILGFIRGAVQKKAVFPQVVQPLRVIYLDGTFVSEHYSSVVEQETDEVSHRGVISHRI